MAQYLSEDELTKLGAKPLWDTASGSISNYSGGGIRNINEIRYQLPTGQVFQYRKATPYDQGYAGRAGAFELASGNPVEGVGSQYDLNQLLQMTTNRNVSQADFQDYYTGKIGLTELQNRVLGTPTYDRSAGPIINQGYGNVRASEQGFQQNAMPGTGFQTIQGNINTAKSQLAQAQPSFQSYTPTREELQKRATDIASSAGVVPVRQGVETKLQSILEKLSAPKTDSLESANTQLRQQYNIGGIEGELQAETEKYNNLQAQYQQDVNAIKSRRGGNVSTIRDRELADLTEKFNAQAAPIDARRRSIAEQLNIKNQMISDIMALKQKDYQNARGEYEFEYNKAISLYSALSQEQNREEDNFRASAQTFVNLLKDRPGTFQNLDEQTKASLNNIELRLGMPIGTLGAYVQAKPGVGIKWMDEGYDANGQKVITFYGEDGSVVKSVRPGMTNQSGDTKLDLLTLDERKKLYPSLPLSLVGKSEQQVIADLESPTPPTWFQEIVGGGFASVNLNDPSVVARWQQFKQAALKEVQNQVQKGTQSDSGA